MLSKLLSLFKTYDTVSVRGATTVNKDTKEEIEIKTNKLLQNIFSSNNLKKMIFYLLYFLLQKILNPITLLVQQE